MMPVDGYINDMLTEYDYYDCVLAGLEMMSRGTDVDLVILAGRRLGEGDAKVNAW